MDKREQLEANIRKIIVDTLARCLNIDPETITDDAKVEKDLGAPSAVVVQVALALQKEYDITCAFMPFRRQKTVGAMTEFTADLLDEE